MPKPATFDRMLVSIARHQRERGHALDTRDAAIRDVIKGIKRERGTARAGRAPILVADLAAMLDAMGDDLAGLCDRALLLVGFAGAFRRSELVGIDIGRGEGGARAETTSAGLVITLHRSKTDQEGGPQQTGHRSGRMVRRYIRDADLFRENAAAAVLAKL